LGNATLCVVLTGRSRTIVETLSYVTIVAGSLSAPILPLHWGAQTVIGGLTALPIFALMHTRFKLFLPALFFALNAVLSPGALAAMEAADLFFPQLYFAPAIVVYLAIVLPVAQNRKQLGWLRVGRMNLQTVVITLGLVFLSAAGLVLWARFLAVDLDRFSTFIPSIPLPLLIAYGIAFALFNSATETFMARAVLFDGFQELFGNAAVSVVLQALVFAAWHFNGFPGGWIGAGLVFGWALALGATRVSSGGLLAPWLAHFFADATIALILLFTLILPS
jgi:hypothetical protein